MPTSQPKLSRVAEAGIAELRQKHGIEPTLDEVIWLHELGKAQEAAGRVDGILDGPVRAGEAFIWPMTISAAQWYRNNASVWFKHSPLFTFYALAFALCHGRGDPIPDTTHRGWFERLVRRVLDLRETRTLCDLRDRRAAAEAVEAWLERIGASRRELEAAVDAVLKLGDQPDDAEEAADMPGVNYDDLIHELAMLSGTDPDYWRTKTSKDATIRAYVNVCNIERARRGSSGPPIADALTEAIRAFRRAIVAIIEAHKPQEVPQ